MNEEPKASADQASLSPMDSPLADSAIATSPVTGSAQPVRQAVPGLPEEYHLVLVKSSAPLEMVARLKILGDQRSTASLGLFVVLFFGLTLTLLAVGEILRMALPDARAMLDAAMALTLIVMLVSPVALAAMLGISLGQAIRQPKVQHRPDLERQWLLKRGSQTVGKLRLLPEALRLRLLWVSLQPNHRGQGIGTAFVRAVLQAEGLPCLLKLSGKMSDGSSGSSALSFFQGCGFRRSPAQERRSHQRGWRKTPTVWMLYEPAAAKP